MKIKMMIGLALLLCSVVYAKKNLEQIKITVAAAAESDAVRSRLPVTSPITGVISAIHGTHTDTVVYAVNVIIKGQHVRLMCDENHKGCTDFGPGEYDGELDKNSVWIIVVEPLTNKVRREHWKISGSW